MRILFFDLSLPHLLADEEFPVGGVAVQLDQWLRGLSELGAESAVMTWRGANAHVGPDPPYLLLETFDPRRGVKVLKYFTSYIPSLFLAARRFRPDVIVQSCASLYTGVLAWIARRLGVPFVYRVACDGEVDERLGTLIQPVERIPYSYGLRAADLVICQNAHQLKQVALMFPGRPSLLIRNAIKVVPNEAPLRSREERTYIAWLGVFRDQKNLPLLLHVAQALPGTEFRVGGMRLAGTSAATQAAVEELGRLQNVRMLGYLKRNQVPQFLGGATALLCTSHFEGFSNAFLEAFVVGTPVLTRKGVDPDMIVEANGLGLVAADDAELIVKVSELSAMRADTFGFLAGKCRGYVEENHTPRVAMQSLVHALDQLIRDRRKIS